MTEVDNEDENGDELDSEAESKPRRKSRKSIRDPEDIEDNEDSSERKSNRASFSAPAPPPPPRYVHSLKAVPQWVIDYNLTHHFDWTWLHDGGIEKYTATLQTLNRDVFTTFEPSHEVVNDPIAYFASHPEEGLVVDDFPMIPNPVPHPLPECQDWKSTCQQLNVADKWLGCKLTATELSAEMPSTRKHVAIAVYNAYVDTGYCHEDLPGTVFTKRATYHFQKWTNNGCYNKKIDRVLGNPTLHDELLDSIGVYPQAPGHFAPQQLPRLLRLLAVAPPSAKLLVSKGSFAEQLLDVLVERKVVDRERLVPYTEHKTHFARVVYRSETYPYQTPPHEHIQHDITDMQVVHRAFVTDAKWEERDLIIFIQRNGARALTNHAEVLNYLRSLSQLSSLGLKVEVFTAAGHIRDHIAMFRRSKMIIAPHGAGLMNVYWATPGTHVIEIGYNRGMVLPDMYFEMTTHSGHQYWLCKGDGDYAGKIQPDMGELKWIVNAALERIAKGEQENQGPRLPAV